MNLSGQVFGRLTAIQKVACPLHYGDDTYKQAAWWECRCECGEVKAVFARSLKNGKTRSCGCLRREICSRLGTELAASRALTGERGRLVREKLTAGESNAQIARDMGIAHQRVAVVRREMVAQ